MRILFLFLDGVGIGTNNLESNPFASAELPTLTTFSHGKHWVSGIGKSENGRGLLIPTDACLGVAGRPQSATGQATILTGVNVPKTIGTHYGPKPNEPIRQAIRGANLIQKLKASGRSVGFVNAYPEGFFKGIESGKRLLSSNQFAMHDAGVELLGIDALYEGRALSADFTGQGAREHLGYKDVPLLTPQEAGHLLAELSHSYDFTFFDHWVTDYVGHRGTLEDAVRTLEVVDGVLEGLLEAWDDSSGLIIVSSDHGNIEDVAARGHTTNPVPTLVIGDGREAFSEGLTDLTGFAPRILHALVEGWGQA